LSLIGKKRLPTNHGKGQGARTFFECLQLANCMQFHKRSASRDLILTRVVQH